MYIRREPRRVTEVVAMAKINLSHLSAFVEDSRLARLDSDI